MECYEKESLTKRYRWFRANLGNAEIMQPLIEKIVNREGIGDILAEGSYRAAQKLEKLFL